MISGGFVRRRTKAAKVLPAVDLLAAINQQALSVS